MLFAADDDIDDLARAQSPDLLDFLDDFTTTTTTTTRFVTSNLVRKLGIS